MATKKQCKCEENDDRHLEDIEMYWTKRSPHFSDEIEASIMEGHYTDWLNLINEEIDTTKRLRVLDCGCGPGFFSIILGREGHHCIGIDYSAGMVEMANRNFEKYGVLSKAYKMDAHNIEFEDNSFDLIVSRNMMWTLADPKRVYSEWMRVLRPGGKIVCFDGNFKLYLHDEEYMEVWKEMNSKEKSKRTVPGPTAAQFKKMEEITGNDFEVCHHRRPQWDIGILLELGATEVSAKVPGISGAYVERNGERHYLPMMFKVCATKADPTHPVVFHRA
ncbi:SAM-dependent methyltransferase [methanogenic archaeon mixed culture ISO4-G1]|nr:SAM-dependent methyltransferase [methanogenic archaeon mixed culture ISO4-G1]